MNLGITTYGSQFAPIPRVIHQTWRTKVVPEAWRDFQQTWRDCHPGWEYQLWTDADIDQLIAEREPEFEATYKAFPRSIQRVDAAKAVILKHRGGVYADLDTQCHRNVSALLAAGGAVMSRTRDGVIDGAFMASAAQHPFWDRVLDEMKHAPWYAIPLRYTPGFQASYVLMTTGPLALRRAARRFVRLRNAARFSILAPRHCSHTSWLRRHRRGRVNPDTFVRHHYSDSWLTPLETAIVGLCTPWRLFGLSAAAAVGVALLVAHG